MNTLKLYSITLLSIALFGCPGPGPSPSAGPTMEQFNELKGDVATLPSQRRLEMADLANPSAPLQIRHITITRKGKLSENGVGIGGEKSVDGVVVVRAGQHSR